MTRKEQDRIANSIAVVRKYYAFAEYAVKASDLIAENIANQIEDTTPRFDRERFLAACKGRLPGERVS